jgi:hypothetical protein
MAGFSCTETVSAAAVPPAEKDEAPAVGAPRTVPRTTMPSAEGDAGLPPPHAARASTAAPIRMKTTGF